MIIMYVYRHESCTCSPKTWLLSMQALSTNEKDLSSEYLLGDCRHEQGADCKVLLQQHRGLLSIIFLCAGGAMASQQSSFAAAVRPWHRLHTNIVCPEYLDVAAAQLRVQASDLVFREVLPL